MITGGVNAWTKSITVARIQSRWPSIGSYRQLRVLSRDGHGPGGGRVLTAAVDGSAGSVLVTGTTVASAFGLMSEWFIPSNPLPTSTLLAPAPVRAPVKAPVQHVAVVVRHVAATRAPAWKLTRYTAYKAVVLKLGSKGTAVVVLQRALKTTADGAFGPKTRAVLVAFEKQQKIAQNGIANKLVWDRFEKRDYPLIAYRGLIQRQGSRGVVTVIIQRALRTPANAVFGSKTVAAVRAVQRRYRLAQTGVVSGATWVAIENQMPR